jgi:hypothetical protein
MTVTRTKTEKLMTIKMTVGLFAYHGLQVGRFDFPRFVR